MANRTARLLASVAIGLIFLVFTTILLLYAHPRGESSFDLTIGLVREDGMEGAAPDAEYDQKGWTVFVQEGTVRRELTANGYGGFTGLEHLGQTFYFSRVMAEEVERPVLTLGAANRAVAVFLDDALLYSDDPAQGSRIGQLELNMLTWDRESITVSLPTDYLGKTLTIAQASSAPETQETPPVAELAVYPCSVRLSPPHAQDRALISQGFSTALLAAFCFALGAAALFFLWKGLHMTWNPGLLLFALACFALMASQILSADFFDFYFPNLTLDLVTVCRAVYISLMLASLGCQGGRGRTILWVLSGLSGALALLYPLTADSLWIILSEWVQLVSLGAVLVLVLLWRRTGNRFCRLYPPMLLAVLILAATAVSMGCLLSPVLRIQLWDQVLAVFNIGYCRFFLFHLEKLFLLPAGAAIVVCVFQWDAQRRAERGLLVQQGERAMENYENLRRHNEELAALRHDLRHHCAVLRGLAEAGDVERLEAYLDDLSSWTQPPAGDYTVNPVVNILLTAYLQRCQEQDIDATVRVELPRRLSLPDADLCALLTNLLENAVEANEKIPDGRDRWLRVTIHIRGQYLYIGVENARCTPVRQDKEHGLFLTDKSGTGHGLGLRSARSIAQKYHSELRLKVTPGTFSASTALLLPEEPAAAASSVSHTVQG